MFKEWPKIPRVENERYHFTEKLDGTNAAVLILPVDDRDVLSHPGALPEATARSGDLLIWTQSRTRLIRPDDDNFGFARWVADNADEIAKLGRGRWFGEWWGKGIQRGYEQGRKRFSLFYYPAELPTAVVERVPTLNFGSLDDAVAHLELYGSVAAPGFMNPEGVVIYCELAKCYYKRIIRK